MRGEPTLVLLYHRVARLASDAHELAVTPEHFAEHVEHLRRHEHPVPLADARQRSRHRRIAVTFDDGYADNAAVAHGILRDAGVPATCFVASDFVDSPTERWWDELELLLLGSEPRARHLRLEIEGRPVLLDVGSAAARRRAHAAVHARVRTRPPSVATDVIEQLRAQIDAPEATRSTHRFLSTEQLRELATSDVVTIGAHTRTHPMLSSLDADAQRAEIVGSREALRDATGHSIDMFAYPFGGPQSYDAGTTKAVADSGFTLACTTSAGLVGPRTDRLRLPRVVVKDWSADELAARIDRWFRHAA